MAGIWHDEAAGAWLLEMRSTAYALGLADGGAALRHLHWGAPLPRAALADLLAAGAGADAGPRATAQPGPRASRRVRPVGRAALRRAVAEGGVRATAPGASNGASPATGSPGRGRSPRSRSISPIPPTRCGSPSPTGSTTASTCSTAGPRCGTAGDGPPVVIRQAHSANWWLPTARELAAALPARRLGGGDPARADVAHPGKGRPRKPPRHHQPPAQSLVHAGPGRDGDRGAGRAVERRAGLERLMEAGVRDQSRRPGPRLRRRERLRLGLPPGGRATNWSCRGSPGCTRPAATARPAANGTPGSWPTSSGAGTIAPA